MTIRIDFRAPGFDTAFDNLLTLKREGEIDVAETVTHILAEVKKCGDDALIDFGKRFDRLTDLSADRLRVSQKEIGEAAAACSPETLDALRLAAGRIEDFHRRQRPEDLDHTDRQGLRLGLRWTPIEAVGLYVPGGTASYPSSVLMNAVPARVAGVQRIAMVVPCPDGHLNPLVLAAADICRIDEIYRIGGAQAIAALAYGTQSVNAVDKIVGPGNAYVAEAKRQVYGTVGIDSIAGPSEITIIADAANDPAWIAVDLLSQAEHDPAAQAILITDDAAFAQAVEKALESQLKSLERADIARKSWRDFGAVIIVEDLSHAAELANRLAPEHLELAVDAPRRLAAKIRNAGAIFLGRYAPEALGDYLAGPNHVLPTGGSARFSSGLGVLDFLKRSSMIECPVEGLRALAPACITLAEAEGLGAHARSLSLRVNPSDREE